MNPEIGTGINGEKMQELNRNAEVVLACGILWRRTADPEAGWQLVESLACQDHEISSLAHSMLVDSGENSMGLLERAVVAGAVDPSIAGPCMADILRSSLTSQRQGRTQLRAAI